MRCGQKQSCLHGALFFLFFFPLVILLLFQAGGGPLRLKCFATVGVTLNDRATGEGGGVMDRPGVAGC